MTRKLLERSNTYCKTRTKILIESAINDILTDIVLFSKENQKCFDLKFEYFPMSFYYAFHLN